MNPNDDCSTYQITQRDTSVEQSEFHPQYMDADAPYTEAEIEADFWNLIVFDG